MNFKVSTEDSKKIREWLRDEVYPEVIKEQITSGKYDDNIVALQSWSSGFPYGGAIGGGVEYVFTPNSIGMGFHVQAYGKKLDLTDYDSW